MRTLVASKAPYLSSLPMADVSSADAYAIQVLPTLPSTSASGQDSRTPPSRVVKPLAAHVPAGALSWPDLIHSAPPVPVPQLVENELRQFAQFLASTFHHNLHCAAECDGDWYRDQLGRDICTVDDAEYLRQLTLDACREHAGLVVPQMVQVGRAWSAAEQREAESLHEYWTALALIVIGILIVFGIWMCVPSDQELRETNFPKLTQTAVSR